MSQSRPAPRRNRRISSLAALTAAAALTTGLLIAGYAATRQQPPAAAPAPAPSPVPSAAPSPVDGSGAGTADAVSVQYSFDVASRGPVLDTAALHPLQPATANGGTIRYAPRGTGSALRFPARCTGTPKACPRAILQGAPDPTLNPGTRPLRYGAAVLMTPADAADGANVLQKGYSVGGHTQFKLQVDHLAAKPSCVIASARAIYRAEGPTTVADGTWHTLACARTGATLALYVDDVVVATRTIPATLAIANPEPLRIGGKGTAANNDQFAGMIDDVFVSIR
jgi:hypothetical protein